MVRRDHGIGGGGSGEAGGAYHRPVRDGTKLGQAHLCSYVALSHELETGPSIAVLCGGSYLRVPNASAEMRRRCAGMCNGRR
jgi:hypothetical protein